MSTLSIASQPPLPTGRQARLALAPVIPFKKQPARLKPFGRGGKVMHSLIFI